MTESAWSVSRTATRSGARFRRPARRFGRGNEKIAALAVAHTLICIAWAVMKHDADYTDAGADYYDRRDARDREHLVRHHQQALARLGCQVALTGPGDGRPPPAPKHPPPQPLARLPDHYRGPPEPAPPALPGAGWGPQFLLHEQANPRTVDT
jgi:transposase